jgi:hypothetical protein
LGPEIQLARTTWEQSNKAYVWDRTMQHSVPLALRRAHQVAQPHIQPLWMSQLIPHECMLSEQGTMRVAPPEQSNPVDIQGCHRWRGTGEHRLQKLFKTPQNGTRQRLGNRSMPRYTIVFPRESTTSLRNYAESLNSTHCSTCMLRFHGY